MNTNCYLRLKNSLRLMLACCSVSTAIALDIPPGTHAEQVAYVTSLAAGYYGHLTDLASQYPNILANQQAKEAAEAAAHAVYNALDADVAPALDAYIAADNISASADDDFAALSSQIAALQTEIANLQSTEDYDTSQGNFYADLSDQYYWYSVEIWEGDPEGGQEAYNQSVEFMATANAYFAWAAAEADQIASDYEDLTTYQANQATLAQAIIGYDAAVTAKGNYLDACRVAAADAQDAWGIAQGDLGTANNALTAFDNDFSATTEDYNECIDWLVDNP